MNKIPERGNFEKGKMKYIIKISLIMERLHSRGLKIILDYITPNKQKLPDKMIVVKNI